MEKPITSKRPESPASVLDALAATLVESKSSLEIQDWSSLEIDSSTPLTECTTVRWRIKESIAGGDATNGIYAIFFEESCLYIGKGKPIWKRVYAHYRESQGDDPNPRWVEFFSKYKCEWRVHWLEYDHVGDPVLSDQLRRLFEHVLQNKYAPLFERERRG
ncbi:MAG: hypothetical protein AAF483_14545 [Planctomycetota bacterium]